MTKPNQEQLTFTDSDARTAYEMLNGLVLDGYSVKVELGAGHDPFIMSGNTFVVRVMDRDGAEVTKSAGYYWLIDALSDAFEKTAEQG